MTLDHCVMVRIHARQLIDIQRLVAGLLAWRVSRRQFPDSARRHAKQLRSLNRDTVLPSCRRACEHLPRRKPGLAVSNQGRVNFETSNSFAVSFKYENKGFIISLLGIDSVIVDKIAG